MKILFILVLLILSSHVLAKAKVLALKGEVTFGGSKVNDGAILRGAGELEVKSRSYIRLRLEDSQSLMAFGGNSKVFINISEIKKLPDINLMKGYVRWLTGPNATKNTGSIKTKNAAMGIRGTSFYASYDPYLDESEIVCFEGSVLLTNAANPKDAKLVGKNQWGGIGGRFGKNLSPILDLKPESVEQTDKSMPLQ